MPTTKKDHFGTQSTPQKKDMAPNKAPQCQWGVGIWDFKTPGAPPAEYASFLDNQGQWWWATTSQQNGVNPAVEKCEPPIGWRTFQS